MTIKMDFNLLMWSFLFGTIGMGMFIYGKKSAHVIPLGAGLALMVVPYFLPNLILMLIICGPLSVLPLVIHE
jgi:hypothetical protein